MRHERETTPSGSPGARQLHIDTTITGHLNRGRERGLTPNAPPSLPPRAEERRLPQASRFAPAKKLPAEIAFLSAFGFSPGTLLQAAANAKELGVAADIYLINEGLIDEKAFYQFLARHLGVPFLHQRTSIGKLLTAAGTLYPQSILAGIVPLKQKENRPRWLAAPRGEMLAQLLLHTLNRSNPPLVITVPSLLSGLVQADFAEEIARKACSNRNFEQKFGSAQIVLTPTQGGLMAAIFCAAILLALGSLNILWLLAALVLGPVFLAGAVHRMAVVASSPRPQPGYVEDTNALPVYTIIVALYRETKVAAQLIGALEKLDYPRCLLDIKLVIEEDDRAMIDCLDVLDLKPPYEIIICPSGFPRTKPRALNIALPLARGEFTVVYDAEDIPDPAQLRAAVASFRAGSAKLACLQAQLVIDNVQDSLLTRLFAIEYAVLFDVVNPGLAFLQLPFPLGGSSNHFRTQILDEAGGWDAWNVTEDADIALRLVRQGYGIDILQSSTHEEAPSHLQAWMAQRRRWIKGWIQTALLHWRNPVQFFLDLGMVNWVSVLLGMTSMIFGPLLGPVFTVLLVRDALFGKLLQPATATEMMVSTFACLICLSGFLSVLIPALLAMRRRRLLRTCGPWLLFFPLIYPLVSWAAWGAVFELFTKPHAWAKTTHGLAKSSRLRDDLAVWQPDQEDQAARSGVIQ